MFKIQLLLCLRKYNHVTETLKELHWLPVLQRSAYKINLITFKVLNELAPVYLKELLSCHKPGRRGLRSASDEWRLQLRDYNLKTYSFRAFSNCAPRLCNELLIYIRSITT